MHHTFAFALLATLTANAYAAQDPSKLEAQVVYTNGNVLTVDKDNSAAEAVAVRDGKILAVGASKALAGYIGANTRVVDLKGKTMIPGIYDAHSHFAISRITGTFVADLNSPPIGTVRNIDDLVGLLKAQQAKVGPQEWISGSGYDDTLLAEKRHPTRADLDKVSSTQPIYITHVSGHLTVANSAALKLAGITADTPNPPGGVIRRDANGEPNGVLEETALPLVGKLRPALTEAQQLEGIRLAGQWYAAHGVTTANHGAGTTPVLLKMLDDSAQAGKLPIRVVTWSSFDTMDAVDKVALTSGKIKVGGVKEFSDGSIQGYTGFLGEHYHTPFHGDEAYRGFPRFTREDLASRVLQVHKSGRQIMIHANGDAAIDDVLYAYRKAQEVFPRKDARQVVIHSQMMREDQLDEVKRLNAIPSFFVLHTYYWGDRHRDLFLGKNRAERISPTRSAKDRGLIYTIHTDTPIVPMEPMRLIWAAVNRVTTSGQVLGAAQRIPVADALRATTINAAYQNFEEKDRGSIEVGKSADLVVLSDNIATVDPMAIKDIKVLETIVEGQSVYQAPN
ncbi:amidohydrolase [Pseudomonas fluorescens]|jgi:predicted amidohydrolase YtcJ|uniref:N-substituted formamide deformylase n=1 Tax=Pseudomonas fluorescens TaxID=294 RepID=A0A5E7VSC2_PSEFL|nr:amidohydrolase [Pseudomonas fluorescens]VVQ25516.1 N-substituted formamide deformylase [Pseudomonas fluorescens]